MPDGPLRNKVEENQANLDERFGQASQKLTEQDALANQKLEELQIEVNQASTTVAQILANVTQQEARLEAALRSHQDSFNTAETARIKQHQDNLNTESTEFESALDKAVEQSRTTLEGQETSGKDVLTRLQELETEAKNVVGVIGNTSTSTGYGQYADAQRKTANWMRRLAIFLFVVAFGVTAYSVYIAENEDTSWKVIVLKATTSVTILAAAAYVARESAQHRGEERRAKEVQLTLVALEPFIVNLDEKDRTDLILATARKVFIKDGKHRDSEDQDGTPSA